MTLRQGVGALYVIGGYILLTRQRARCANTGENSKFTWMGLTGQLAVAPLRLFHWSLCQRNESLTCFGCVLSNLYTVYTLCNKWVRA